MAAIDSPRTPTRCSRASCSPTGRGSGSSSARRRRRAWAALALQRARRRPAARGGAPAVGVRALRPRARRRPTIPRPGAAIAGMRDVALERGSLRLRVAAAWYAAEHALRTGRVAEAENHARLALDLVDDGHNVVQRRRRRGAGARAGRARRVRRGARAAARAAARRRARARGVGDRPAPRPRAAVRWPRATSSAPTPRRWRRARCAPSRAARTRRSSPGARPPRARSPTSGGATRRRRWPTPSSRWRERFGAPVADRRRAARPRRRRARPGRARRALRARRWPSPPRASGLASVRLRLELGSALAYMGRRVEARDALRPALADADAAGAVAARRSAPGASSWRPACARARRRSKAPRP